MRVFGKDCKKEILRRAKSLSSRRFNNVFIAPDLAKKKQEDKDLREHVILFREEVKDQEIRIKGRKVVKTSSENKM